MTPTTPNEERLTTPQTATPLKTASNAPRALATKAVLWLVKFYQVAISPLHGPCCRFTPTCSQYCVLAIQKYGLVRGLFKTVWRILRCNPFCKGGYDPP